MKIILLITFCIISYSQEKIAFTKNREIHIMNSDGMNINQLIDYKVSGHTPVSLRASFTRSGKIAYIYGPVRHGWMSTYIMHQDGSNKVRISDEPRSKDGSTWDSSVSPDGKYYIFVSNRIGNDEIYRMDYDGKNTKELKYLKGYVHSVAYSKDGNKIVYTLRNRNYSDIYIMDVDGSDSHKIITASKWTRVSFSSDSKSIVFVLDLNGRKKLHIIDVTGKNFTKLLGSNSDDQINPQWIKL